MTCFLIPVKKIILFDLLASISFILYIRNIHRTFSFQYASEQQGLWYNTLNKLLIWQVHVWLVLLRIISYTIYYRLLPILLTELNTALTNPCMEPDICPSTVNLEGCCGSKTATPIPKTSIRRNHQKIKKLYKAYGFSASLFAIVSFVSLNLQIYVES